MNKLMVQFTALLESTSFLKNKLQNINVDNVDDVTSKTRVTTVLHDIYIIVEWEVKFQRNKENSIHDNLSTLLTLIDWTGFGTLLGPERQKSKKHRNHTNRIQQTKHLKINIGCQYAHNSHLFKCETIRLL